jgi:hypothetical protein
MRKVLEAAENLHLREGMAVDLAMGPNDEVEGIVTHFGMCFGAKAVVLTTGTFMNGTIWVGRKQLPAGRCALCVSVSRWISYSRHSFVNWAACLVGQSKLGNFSAVCPVHTGPRGALSWTSTSNTFPIVPLVI